MSHDAAVRVVHEDRRVEDAEAFDLDAAVGAEGELVLILPGSGEDLDAAVYLFDVLDIDMQANVELSYVSTGIRLTISAALISARSAGVFASSIGR